MRDCSVIGAGYVGLIQAVGLAALGRRVTCLDVNEARIATLRAGEPPIVEEGLRDALGEVLSADAVAFTADSAALADAPVCFVAVGTPTDPVTGNANLRFLWSAARAIADHAPDGTAVVVKSTVPIGTCARLQEMLDEWAPGRGLEVVSNPEFLREGTALEDFNHPERIVLGGRSREATEAVAALYAPFAERGVPVLRTDWHSSETIKYAANAFLATKVTFINEIANLTEAVGGDIEAVAYGIGLDSRIGGRFLKVGPGYGGSCFPKDTLALAVTAQRHGVRQEILESVIAANDARRFRILQRVRQLADRRLFDARIAVLGLAFKANTDDVRDSPAIGIVHMLLGEGARVRAYDPVARYDAKDEDYEQVDSIEAAARDADLVLVTTEWPEFARFDYARLNEAVRQRALYDLRLVTGPDTPGLEGWTVARIGAATRDEPAVLPMREAAE